MKGVFVSYAREDSQKAKAVAQVLEQASLDVWFDERIHSGSEFSREIETALKSAVAVVVLWSRSSVDSPWVRDEAAEGRDSGRMVPVLLDGCRPPIGFRQFQATDLSHWSGRGKPAEIDELISAVRAKAGAPATEIKPVQAKSFGWSRPITWSAIAAGVLVATIASILIMARIGNGPARVPSVAILPFSADSADAQQRELASGARDAIAHTLSQTEYRVGLADSLPQSGHAASDFVVSGDVSGSSEKMVLTVRVEDTVHNAVVYSNRFETERVKAGDLPDQIGAQIAGSLRWAASLLMLDRSYPSDPAITAELFRGSDYQTARQITARAPNSLIAQFVLASSVPGLLPNLPLDQRAEAATIGRRALDRVRVLAPRFGGAEIIWCQLHSHARMIDCEDHLRAGMRRDPGSPGVGSFLAGELKDVGRTNEALQLTITQLANDPYVPVRIGLELRMLEALGRHDEADDLYRNARKGWPDDPVIPADRVYGMMDRGDFEGLEQFGKELQSADQVRALSPALPVIAAIKAKDAAEIRHLCPPTLSPGFRTDLCMLALGQIGDNDDAFAVAWRIYPNRIGRTPAEEDKLWLEGGSYFDSDILMGSAAAPLRRDPRFLELARRLGVLAYWRIGRLPDFCQPPQPEPICAQLRKGS